MNIIFFFNSRVLNDWLIQLFFSIKPLHSAAEYEVIHNAKVPTTLCNKSASPSESNSHHWHSPNHPAFHAANLSAKTCWFVQFHWSGDTLDAESFSAVSNWFLISVVAGNEKQSGGFNCERFQSTSSLISCRQTGRSRSRTDYKLWTRYELLLLLCQITATQLVDTHRNHSRPMCNT